MQRIAVSTCSLVAVLVAAGHCVAYEANFTLELNLSEPGVVGPNQTFTIEASVTPCDKNDVTFTWQGATAVANEPYKATAQTPAQGQITVACTATHTTDSSKTATKSKTVLVASVTSVSRTGTKKVIEKDSSDTIEFKAATSPENAAVAIEWMISADGGTTWTSPVDSDCNEITALAVKLTTGFVLGKYKFKARAEGSANDDDWKESDTGYLVDIKLTFPAMSFEGMQEEGEFEVSVDPSGVAFENPQFSIVAPAGAVFTNPHGGNVFDGNYTFTPVQNACTKATLDQMPRYCAYNNASQYMSETETKGTYSDYKVNCTITIAGEQIANGVSANWRVCLKGLERNGQLLFGETTYPADYPPVIGEVTTTEFDTVSSKYKPAGHNYQERQPKTEFYLPSGSHFRKKIEEHEGQHAKQWSEGMFASVFDVADLWAIISALRASSDSEVRQQAAYQCSLYLVNGASKAIAETVASEIEAYHQDMQFDPKYLHKKDSEIEEAYKPLPPQQ